MIIVSDTSCISNLIHINCLELLNKLYGIVVITSIVEDELKKFHELDTTFFQRNNIRIRNPKNSIEVLQLKNELDAGESSSIILAIELNADFLLIDERKGTTIAKTKGLNTIGLLGVLLLAKQKKVIHALKPLLDDLKNQTSFYCSPTLYNHILALANEQ